ncbi:hypothetical protein [Streptomyces sp. NPDC059894]|uniref:hypothetical protein n=1 Tax=unclassified Streptomyces TaxID=2593676 RepID=UPI00365F3262
MKGGGCFAQCRIRRAERIVHYPHRGLPGILGIGLVAEMVDLVKEGELVGDRPEGGGRLAGGAHSSSEAGDDPGGVELVLLGCGTEEGLVAQIGDQLAEFGDLLSDGAHVGRAVAAPGNRELATLAVEG